MAFKGIQAISTFACAELGWVHDGMMVNVRPDNARLRPRGQAIVARVAGVSEAAAAEALHVAGDDIPITTAVAAGALDRATARMLLDACGGDIAEVLERLKAPETWVNSNAGMKPAGSGG